MNQQSQDIDLDDEEILCENEESDQKEKEFDDLVYQIQELLISDEFEEIQNGFIREKCKIFNSNTDNKPEHMNVFKEYQKILEKFIGNRVSKNMENFSMQNFTNLLKNHSDYVDEQILETLLSFSDFQLFKDIMIEHKIRVEEEERTIRKKTNKATDKSKQQGNANIFSVNQQVFIPDQKFVTNKQQIQKQVAKKEEEEIQEGDLRPDLFLSITAFQTPKLNKKKQ